MPQLVIAGHPDDLLDLLNQRSCRDTERLRGSQQQAQGRLALAPLKLAVVRTVDVCAQRELVLRDTEPLTKGANCLPERLGRNRVKGRCSAEPWLS